MFAVMGIKFLICMTFCTMGSVPLVATQGVEERALELVLLRGLAKYSIDDVTSKFVWQYAILGLDVVLDRFFQESLHKTLFFFPEVTEASRLKNSPEYYWFCEAAKFRLLNILKMQSNPKEYDVDQFLETLAKKVVDSVYNAVLLNYRGSICADVVWLMDREKIFLVEKWKPIVAHIIRELCQAGIFSYEELGVMRPRVSFFSGGYVHLNLPPRN